MANKNWDQRPGMSIDQYNGKLGSVPAAKISDYGMGEQPNGMGAGNNGTKSKTNPSEKP